MPGVGELIRAYRSFARRVRLTGDGEVARLAAAGRVVLEGAQGVLLDEWRGFHPHTTWSTSTFANALDLLSEAGVDADVCRLGVTRTYATRHGAGPFPAEDPSLAPLLPEPHNGTGRWQGAFRVGHLDLVLLRYALEVCGGADALAVTHLDSAAGPARDRLRVATAWRAGGTRITRLRPGPFADLDHQRRLTALASAAAPELTVPDRPWPALLSGALGVPVAVTSWGPRTGDKRVPAMDVAPRRAAPERLPVP